MSPAAPGVRSTQERTGGSGPAEGRPETSFTSLTPIFGLALGRMFFDESIAPLVVLGVVVSIAGIVGVSAGDRLGAVRAESAR